ncbi:MAG: hypothetical protein PWP67_1846 [Clostridium butyricum]|nr:hypothetical protein [Clostridium butyricum]
MKILMVNKFLYPNGGSEAYMFKLGEYLQARGHKVQYFGMDNENRCVENELNKYVSSMNLRDDKKLKQITYPLKTIYSFEAKKKIGCIIDKFKPDIVHMNNINYQLTPSIIYEIKKRNIPIVQTVHDVQIVCPNHRLYIEKSRKICEKCLDGKYINCVKEKCVHGSIAKSIIAAIEAYYYHIRNTYNLVDCYICPSRFIQEKIQQGGIEKKRTNVMYNFVDKIDKKTTIRSNKRYVLYFGRLSIEKGIDTLIKVCKELKDIKFIIAGTGPLEESVKNIANVEFVGFLKGESLRELISNASLSLYPSEWYENCPLSVIESQALGTPVLASDLGGTKELIRENKTGKIFRAGDIDHFRNTLKELWNNQKLLDEMSKECFKLKKYTIDSYYNDLIRVYNNLISIKEKN